MVKNTQFPSKLFLLNVIICTNADATRPAAQDSRLTFKAASKHLKRNRKNLIRNISIDHFQSFVYICYELKLA